MLNQIYGRINPLTESDIISLEEAYRTSDKNHVRERCKCILMCNSGYDVKELSDFFETRRQTIYSWLNRWEFAGIDGFLSKSGQDRAENQRWMQPALSSLKLLSKQFVLILKIYQVLQLR